MRAEYFDFSSLQFLECLSTSPFQEYPVPNRLAAEPKLMQISQSSPSPKWWVTSTAFLVWFSIQLAALCLTVVHVFISVVQFSGNPQCSLCWSRNYQASFQTGMPFGLFAACRNVIVVSSAVKQRVELWKGSSQLRQVIDCWRSTGVCPLTNETAHNLKVTWDARSVWRPFSHNFLHKMES